MSHSPLPHQIRGINGVWSAIDLGHQAICMTSPTGGGKGLCISEMIRKAAYVKQWGVLLYTHRRMLLNQLTKELSGFGIEHGIIAAGHESADHLPVQLAMMQTVAARASIPLGKVLVVVDECHDMVGAGTRSKAILDAHIEDGAVVVGTTATPLDIGHFFTHLVVAGTNSELRRCGMLVPCFTASPPGPDLRKLRPQSNGEFVESEVSKRMVTPVIFGSVYDHWKILNADARPSILFAPGVKESKWFVDEFEKKGVKAAHMDGEHVYHNGEEYPSTPEARKHVADMSRSGEISILSNRFLCREGVNWPWLEHLILATAFGSLTGYLQSGGRALRASVATGKVRCVCQDHGGNRDRHGSLNDDRLWALEQTDNGVVRERLERMREQEIPEPYRCSNCSCLISPEKASLPCPFCGYKFSPHTRTRPVIQLDGSLKMDRHFLYKKRVVRNTPDAEKKWLQCYFRCKKSKTPKSFSQARALYFRENHTYPPEGLPFMPRNASDWTRKIGDVPASELCRRRTGGAE